jgi:hypothetical protein
MFTVVMDNVGRVFVNVMEVILVHDVTYHVSLYKKKRLSNCLVSFFFFYIIADLCAGINCIYGTCQEGRCVCSEGYTGYYCDTPGMKRIF